jgi:DNA-binding CsgD family transcriptional regulator
MVGAGNKLTDGLKSRVEALLKAGRLMAAPVSLTRREGEVLRGVMQSQANKEIAAALNLSERTIKFHISSLLAKFGVRSRMELAREAARASLPGPYVAGVDLLPVIGSPVHSLALPRNTVRPPTHKGAVVPMRGRRMTA